jgi:UDP-galactopyranose mutase
MPDVETQTEQFIILTLKQQKNLTIPEKQLYKMEYKEFKHDKSVQRHREYCRNYQRTWNRMKYKYDPVFREKHKEHMAKYREKKKLKKQLEKELNNVEISQHPQPLQTPENSIINQLGLLIL